MAMANDRVHPRKRKKVCSFWCFADEKHAVPPAAEIPKRGWAQYQACFRFHRFSKPEANLLQLLFLALKAFPGMIQRERAAKDELPVL